MNDMAEIIIGRTRLKVEQNGFGALPIQRISTEDAVYLLHKAYNGGMNYYDSARGYTDSEEKLGKAFAGMWDKVIIATKTPAKNVKEFWSDLELSLRLLQTDHIDVFQFHNPPFCPKPGDESGLYEAMLQAQQQGKVRFIGITNHRLSVAEEAVESGLYDSLQFPFSYLATERELALVRACKEKEVGFIAMKALSGGLITNSAAACAWITRFDNVVPIWGIQKEWELDEFLSYIPTPPTLSDEMLAAIAADCQELQGEFCRGCGYCTPCPQGIAIPTCARASLLLRRAPSAMLLSERGKQMMQQIEDCIECGQCSAQCPYGLDTPALLKRNYQDFQEVLAGKPL
jgi:predicted aldo/keto reductase-like oxidoreductase